MHTYQNANIPENDICRALSFLRVKEQYLFGINGDFMGIYLIDNVEIEVNLYYLELFEEA